MSLPKNTIGPSDEISRSSARPSVVLPEPDSPTTAERFALAYLQADAIDRFDVSDRGAQQAALDRKPDLQDRPPTSRRESRAAAAPGSGFGSAASSAFVYGCFGAVKTCSTGPCSTILPLFMTQNHVGDAAHDAEIVGDEQQAHAEPRAKSPRAASGLRLHGKRSSAVVGSSGDQQIRLVGERPSRS